MRNRALVALIIIASLLVTGCQSFEGISPSEQDPDANFVELTNETAKKAVWDNLDRIEVVLTEYYDEQHESIVTEAILDETNDTDEINDFLRPYRGAFRALVADEQLEERMREYVYLQYHSKDDEYLLKDSLHIRFRIVEQTADQFKATFIQLADETSHPEPLQHTVTYVKEHQEWLLEDYDVDTFKEDSLELTVGELKDYYRAHTFTDAELITTVDDYFILKLTPFRNEVYDEPQIIAINIHDSSVDEQLAQSYK